MRNTQIIYIQMKKAVNIESSFRFRKESGNFVVHNAGKVGDKVEERSITQNCSESEQ